MIETQFFRTRKDGKKLYRTYSTEGKKIKKISTDEIYDEAIDLEQSQFDYEETEENADFGRAITE